MVEEKSELMKDTKEESSSDKSSEGISVSDVKLHNSDSDCWVIIHGKVYDVTKYLDDHPGGPEIIMDVAGKDVSGDFEDTGHSDDARQQLKDLFIGDVKGGSTSSATEGGSSSKTSTNLTLFLTFGVAIVAGVAVIFQEQLYDFLKSNNYL